MKKNIYKIIAVFTGLLIGIVSSILILEIVLRLYPKFGYNYNSFRTTFASNPSLRDWNTSAQKYFYRPSSLLGYEHVPNCKPYTNRYGFIGKEYNLKKSKGVYRILIIGDSIAEQRWPADFLEEKLNKGFSSIYKFEVWNTGVGSYDVRRYALFLKYRALIYKPDMVIIYLFMNDFDLNTFVYYKTKDHIFSYDFYLEDLYKKGFWISPLLMQYSSAYRYLILKLSSYLSHKGKKDGVSKLESNGKHYLGIIKDICNKRKTSLYMVVFPYLKNIDMYKNYQKDEYSTIVKVLKELEMSYIDLYGLYDRLIKNNFDIRDKKDDEIHPSIETHKLIAEEVYLYIQNEFMNK
jgi:lysophospholipase L1-like esterase